MGPQASHPCLAKATGQLQTLALGLKQMSKRHIPGGQFFSHTRSGFLNYEGAEGLFPKLKSGLESEGLERQKSSSLGLQIIKSDP